MKSGILGEKAEVFGRKPQRAFWKTLLRLEENASAFEFKWTCVLGKAFVVKCTCVLEKAFVGVVIGVGYVDSAFFIELAKLNVEMEVSLCLNLFLCCR